MNFRSANFILHNISFENFVSNEINPNRNVASIIQGPIKCCNATCLKCNNKGLQKAIIRNNLNHIVVALD